MRKARQYAATFAAIDAAVDGKRWGVCPETGFCFVGTPAQLEAMSIVPKEPGEGLGSIRILYEGGSQNGFRRTSGENCRVIYYGHKGSEEVYNRTTRRDGEGRIIFAI